MMFAYLTFVTIVLLLAKVKGEAGGERKKNN